MFSNSPTIRKIVYAAAVLSSIASFFSAVFFPELVVPFVSTAGLLTTVAGVQAFTNITPASQPPFQEGEGLFK